MSNHQKVQAPRRREQGFVRGVANSLIARLLALVVVVTLVPLLIYVAIASDLLYQTLVTTAARSLEQQCLLVARDVDRFIERRVSNARVVSQADVFEADDPTAIQRYVEEVAAADGAVDAITVTDLEGNVLASGGPRNLNAGEQWQASATADESVTELFADARQAQQGDVFVSEAVRVADGASILLLTPVTDDPNTTVIKVLIIEIQLQRVQQIVSEFDDSVLGDKSVYLVDNAGRVVTSRDTTVGVLEKFPDLNAEPSLAERFSKPGDIGNLIYRDAGGDEVLAGYADLAEFGKNQALDWSIIAVAPIRDVTAAARTTRNRLLLTGAAIVLASLVLTLMLGQSVTRPLQLVVHAANELREGRFETLLPENQPREIQSISLAFRAMAKAIEDRTVRLADEERRYRLLLELIPTGVQRSDLEGRITFANPMLAQILGCPADELIGRFLFEFQETEEARLSLKSYYRELVERQPLPTTFEARNRTVDGRLIEVGVEWAYERDADGQLTGCISAISDLTATRHMANIIRLSEERLRDLFDNSSDMIISVNPEGRLIFFNRAWLDILGHTSEGMTDRSVFDFVFPDELDRCQQLFDRLLRGEDIGQLETVLWTRDRVRVDVEFRCTCRYNDDRTIAEIRAIVSDVTERRRAERFLEKENRLLENFARGVETAEALHQLVRFIEDQADDLTASILLLDDSGTRLRHGAAPGLSAGFNEAIDGAEIGANAGSCGTAAWRGQPVFVDDIETSPLWHDYRDLARTEGMRACWSMPVKDTQNVVLATFAVYRRLPGLPDEHDQKLLNTATHLASLLLTRARDEQIHRNSEEQYRLITEAAFDGVVVMEDGKFVEINRAFVDMFGFTLEELRGQTPHAIATPDSAETAVRHIQEGFEGLYEIVGIRKDGTKLRVEILGRNLSKKGRSRRVTAMRDVTERRRLEEKQRELHDRNAALVSVLGEILFEWRPKTNEVFWEGDYQGVLGRTVEQMGNDTAFGSSLTHPDDLKMVLAKVEAASNGDQIVDVEIRMRHADGHYLWVHYRGFVLLDDAGEVDRFIGAMRDITEKRSLTEELRVLNIALEQRVTERTTELQQANDDLEAYAHSVAHDLRAPLRAMYGFSKALREDYEDRLDDDGREYTEFIESAAHQMDALISDLLEYSKVGRSEMSIDPCDLDDIVERSLKQLKADIDLRNPQLSVDRPLGRVIGHRSTLVQVMSNLISNAMKFVENGVTPAVRIRSQDQGGCVRLWVEDNGIGIDPEFQARIFRVFERLHGIETYPGTGIGLAIVRRAIESMNGRFGVESAPGEGSRFWIELPLEQTS